jgi:MraZ protein
MAVPARLRDRFAEGAVIAWWLDPCLVVVPRLEWTSLVERTFGEMSVLDDDQRELSRFLLAGAFDQDLDRQGRVVLPAELRDHAGIGDRVKVVGAGDYIEIWNPEELAARFSELRDEGVSQRAKRLADRMA